MGLFTLSVQVLKTLEIFFNLKHHSCECLDHLLFSILDCVFHIIIEFGECGVDLLVDFLNEFRFGAKVGRLELGAKYIFLLKKCVVIFDGLGRYRMAIFDLEGILCVEFTLKGSHL